MLKKDISFGLFLVEKECIREDDLLDALEYQHNNTLPLGRVSIMRRDLSHEQVLNILKYQQEAGERRPFGDVAVQLGYLGEKQVKALLEHQKMLMEPLDQVLVNIGKIKQEKINEALLEYKSQAGNPSQNGTAEFMKEPLNVLVVDDETPICVNIAALLKLNGFHAETAANGFEALKKMEEREFHVIVSDVIMPEMSGLSLLSQIQEKAPLSETILITGNANQEIVRNSLRKGAFGFIAKPVKFSKLLEMIKDAGKHYARNKDMISTAGN